MSAVIATSRRTVLLRWLEPTVEDFGPLHTTLSALAAAHPGQSIHYLGVTDDRTGQTSPEFRARSVELARSLLAGHPELATFILVPVETGVKASLMRSMLRSMVTMGRLVDATDLKRVRVAASIDDVATLLGPAVDMDELRRFLA